MQNHLFHSHADRPKGDGKERAARRLRRPSRRASAPGRGELALAGTVVFPVRSGLR